MQSPTQSQEQPQPKEPFHSAETWMNLPSLGLSLRVLFTGYLLTIGLGLMMAGGQLLLTHGMADGEFGLSLDDVVYSYYGDRENSKIESKLNGSMKDKASPEERQKIIFWARKGASEAEWESTIKPIVQARCVKCHGVIPAIPDFNNYEALKQVAAVDEGIGLDSLTRLSHIHLFGISFIFFLVGLIFSFAVGISKLKKEIIISIPFIFLVLDVLSWWLTKLHPGFAYFTMVGGMGYAVCMAIMILTSFYQMWVLPYNGKEYKINEWLDG